jgi:hypothetical protein
VEQPFFNGLKFFAIELPYAAPVILLIIITFLPFFSTLIAVGIL